MWDLKACATWPSTVLLKTSCTRFFPIQNLFVVEGSKDTPTPPAYHFQHCFQRHNPISLACRRWPCWVRQENAHINSSFLKTYFCPSFPGVPWNACRRRPPANKQLGFWNSESLSSFVVHIQICDRASSSIWKKGWKNQFLLKPAWAWSLCKTT